MKSGKTISLAGTLLNPRLFANSITPSPLTVPGVPIPIDESVNFAGGECGHMVIMVDGEACTCGRRGCWEAYASATALIRQTKEAMEKYPDSVMHELAKAEGKVSGRTAFDAMRKGDIAGFNF